MIRAVLLEKINDPDFFVEITGGRGIFRTIFYETENFSKVSMVIINQIVQYPKIYIRIFNQSVQFYKKQKLII